MREKPVHARASFSPITQANDVDDAKSIALNDDDDDERK